MQKEEKTNEPIDRIRVGRVEATIWENEGENGTWRSVTLSRTYKDADGNLRNASSFSGTDLLLASAALLKAYESITTQ